MTKKNGKLEKSLLPPTNIASDADDVVRVLAPS
jgi:hypothetical protein